MATSTGDASRLHAIHSSNDSILTRLVSRLEAATSRLEDIASSAASFEAASSESPLASISAPSTAKPIGASSQNLAPTASKTAPTPPAIEDFDSLVTGDVKAYLDLSQELGGPIAEQVRYRRPHSPTSSKEIDLNTHIRAGILGFPCFCCPAPSACN